MRLLHRLNQYQRLWQPSAGAPQQVTVGELAERCFCSERHVRTLLRQAQEAGWLSWQASSGRGKRGQLLFHKTPESLRNEMMEQALNNGQQQTALELAQLCPGGAESPAPSLPRRSVAKQYPHAAYSLLSPAGAAASRLSPGRAEQHLAGQIYAGLTRFDEGDNMPIGDLAHHWQVSRTACAGILYPLHAVLAQWRYGGNRAVATAVTAAA